MAKASSEGVLMHIILGIMRLTILKTLLIPYIHKEDSALGRPQTRTTLGNSQPLLSINNNLSIISHSDKSPGDSEDSDLSSESSGDSGDSDLTGASSEDPEDIVLTGE